MTTRQLVLDHASKENIGVDTAWRDWGKVKEWNDEDWEKDREKMIARLLGRASVVTFRAAALIGEGKRQLSTLCNR